MMFQSNAVNLTQKKCKRRKDSNGQCGRQPCFEEGAQQHLGGDDSNAWSAEAGVGLSATHLKGGWKVKAKMEKLRGIIGLIFDFLQLHIFSSSWDCLCVSAMTIRVQWQLRQRAVTFEY